MESEDKGFLKIFDFWYNVELDYLSIIEDMKINNAQLMINVINQTEILSTILKNNDKTIEKINKNIEKETKKLTSGNLALTELSELQSNNPEKFSDDNKENEKLELEKKIETWNNTIISLEERKKSFKNLSNKISEKFWFNKKNFDKIVKEEIYLSYIEEIKIIKENIENSEFKDTCIKIINKTFGEEGYKYMNDNSFVFDFNSQKKLMELL